MQLKIIIHLQEPLTLPLSYHHTLQAIIYNLMGDAYGSSALHDGGKSYGNRQYKLFTFSLLEGKTEITGKQITFTDSVSFEVRCIDENIIKCIEDNVLKNGIQFTETVYTDIECIRKNKRVTDNVILIKMISPVCVYKTLPGSTHANYLNPMCNNFSEEINNNFHRKYQAAQIPTLPPLSEDDNITISPIKINPKDKYLTIYKKIIIEAYNGVYVLSGKPEFLDFLYNVGIGSKNSQGFGMFNILNNIHNV